MDLEKRRQARLDEIDQRIVRQILPCGVIQLLCAGEFVQTAERVALLHLHHQIVRLIKRHHCRDPRPPSLAHHTRPQHRLPARRLVHDCNALRVHPAALAAMLISLKLRCKALVQPLSKNETKS